MANRGCSQGKNLVETEFSKKVSDGKREDKKKGKGGRAIYECSSSVLFPSPFPSPNHKMHLKQETEGTNCCPSQLLRRIQAFNACSSPNSFLNHFILIPSQLLYMLTIKQWVFTLSNISVLQP